MKTPVKAALFALLIASFTGCATEEELRRRDAERAREDRREEARDRQLDEEDWQDYLEDYARDLGKRKSELTASERRAARREYDDGGRRRGPFRGRGYRGYGYWY